MKRFNLAFGHPILQSISMMFLLSVSLFFGFIWAAEKADYRNCIFLAGNGLSTLTR